MVLCRIILLQIFAVIIQVHSQLDPNGFLSIDCGLPAKSSYDDSGTGLKYVSDEQYIDTGNYSQISSTYVTNNLAKEYFTVRYFPTGTRNCYTIRSLNTGIKYLVRATFYYGNYDKLNTPPIFDIYLGVNFWDTVNSNLEYYYEIMVEATADYLEVCLVNVGNGNPFISSLYLRPLKGTHPFVNSTQSLVLMKRLNIGAGKQELVRYPDDMIDRWWWNYTESGWNEISTNSTVEPDDEFKTPSLVLQTAATTSSTKEPLNFNWYSDYKSTEYYFILHFNEIQKSLTGRREFDIVINGIKAYDKSFPIKYLGLPLHDKKLSVQDWRFLVDKVGTKLHNWQGQLLSLGGRKTLLNSVLTAVPLYAFSLFKVPASIIREIDKIRCRFMWQGTDKKRKKYSLIKWPSLCMKKEYGGLGIINLRHINISLLTKWWWKYKDPSFHSQWKTLIHHIYVIEHQALYSPFWSTILKLNSLGHTSISFTPGTQSKVKFWVDIWHNNCSLATLYPQLFDICWQQQVLLADVVNSQGECVAFRRTLTGVDQQEWGSILHLISTISFTHAHDKVAWRWETSGQFSVRSLYSILNFRGILVANAMLWWSLPIPHKIQIFMWIACQHKILTKDVLHTRGWNGPMKCQFCDNIETANHLFIECPFVKQVWFWMGQSQHYFSGWHTIEDVIKFALTLNKFDQIAFLMIFSAICWTIWKHRNELCFQIVTPKTSRSLIFLIISLIQYWLGKKKMKDQTQEAAQKWMPTEEMLDTIPLRIWCPGDDQLVPYHFSADHSEGQASN